MKMLKIIVVIILILVAIPLIIALFVAKEYEVAREIVVNKPKQMVFNYVKYLKNQDDYSKWVRTDPGMKKTFSGTDGTAGFVYAWDGNKEAGKGEQEIKKITEGERVDVELRFEKPFKSTASAPMITEAVSENQTKVIWQIKGKSKYPLNLMNLVINRMLGKDMETSLIALKNILEK